MTDLSSYLTAHLTAFKRSGAMYSMAVCPFHADANPSLSITTASGAYRCFSCGARGDLALLIAKIERLPLGAAIAKARQLREGAAHV